MWQMYMVNAGSWTDRPDRHAVFVSGREISETVCWTAAKSLAKSSLTVQPGLDRHL